LVPVVPPVNVLSTELLGISDYSAPDHNQCCNGIFELDGRLALGNHFYAIFDFIVQIIRNPYPTELTADIAHGQIEGIVGIRRPTKRRRHRQPSPVVMRDAG
jgi:hypothetical protein